jgi:hypothetical protein
VRERCCLIIVRFCILFIEMIRGDTNQGFGLGEWHEKKFPATQGSGTMTTTICREKNEDSNKLCNEEEFVFHNCTLNAVMTWEGGEGLNSKNKRSK